MKQSKYLITAATGSEAIMALLANGQQDIRAFVHREDERSELLLTQRVEVVVGNLLDFHAVKTALQGVNRAYFCFPIMPGIGEATAQFAQVAKEVGVDTLVNTCDQSRSRSALLRRYTWLRATSGIARPYGLQWT